MRTRSKLLLGALAATVILGASISTATAARLSTNEQAIRATFRELVFTGFEGLINITCPVTLEGSFHSRTITKTSGLLVGNISRAAITQTACRGGTAIILNGSERLPNGTTTTTSLPWHVRYDSFRGTLPTITGVRLQLINASFLLNVVIFGSTVSCLYSSSASRPAFGIAELNTAGLVTGLRAEETTTIPKFAGEASCPATGRFTGRANVTRLNETGPIIITLVA